MIPWPIPWNNPGQNTGGLFLSPGHLPNSGTKLRSPALQADSLPTEPQGKPLQNITWSPNCPATATILKIKCNFNDFFTKMGGEAYVYVILGLFKCLVI